MNEGFKLDKDKPKYLNVFKYLDWEFLKECSEVMAKGEKVYGFENWKKQLNPDRIKNALIRHELDYFRGKEIDIESGKSHLSHIFCNIMFLYYYDHLRNTDNEKR